MKGTTSAKLYHAMEVRINNKGRFDTLTDTGIRLWCNYAVFGPKKVVLYTDFDGISLVRWFLHKLTLIAGR